MTAFLTIILMPLTYSIAYGLIAGIVCYVIMTGTFRLLEFVGIKTPVFEPPQEEDALEALIHKKDEVEGEGPKDVVDGEMEVEADDDADDASIDEEGDAGKSDSGNSVEA